MSPLKNPAVRFAQKPASGLLEASTFAIVDAPMPDIEEGELLVRLIYISIDAGSRAQLDDKTDYPIKAQIGKVLGSSGAVAQVVASQHPAWAAGDYVATTHTRWQKYQRLRPNSELLLRVDPQTGPLAMHLGTLGMVGFTAYVGIFEIGKPQAGETVLISAAAGATGSLAGQFARIAGARVVGIAGGPAKCEFVKNTLGFDDCIDYRAGDLDAQIQAACPNGVDVYYENVGGDIQRAALAAMNLFGRVVLCGQIGQYSGAGAVPGPNLMGAIVKRLTLRGFLANDHMNLHPQFLRDVSEWYRQGKVRHDATITEGFDNIHEAINSLTQGKNIGKQLCQVDAEVLS